MTATTNFHDLELLETCLEDLENSLGDIKKEMTKKDSKAQAIIMKLKHEKLRAMAVVTRSRSILARMELMLAKTELGLEVQNLRNNNSNRRSSTASRKKSNDENNDSSSKKIKLSPVRKLNKQKSKSHTSKSNKENVKESTLPKKQTANTPENVLKPQVSNNTPNSSSTSPNMLCSLPLPNLTTSTWPVQEKKTIFLSNPPVRDTNINKNIGYYSSAYAKQHLGYDPDTLTTVPRPTLPTMGNSIQCKGFSTNYTFSVGSTNQQVYQSQTQVNPAYNLSVTPGYNLSLMPGYIVQPKGQHNRTSIDDTNKKFDSISGCSTPKITSSTPDGASDNVYYKTTNQLFRDLMCNKSNDVKVEDNRSLASIDTLVIKTNIETDFHNLSPEY